MFSNCSGSLSVSVLSFAYSAKAFDIGWLDFASAEQVRDYLVNYGYGTKDQYTIIPQEEEQ